MTVIESYTGVDDSSVSVYSTNYAAQVFTVGFSGVDGFYEVSDLDIRLQRVGTVTSTTIYICGLSELGEPNIEDILTSSTVDTTSLSTATGGEVVNFVFSTNPPLNPSSSYAIVVTSNGADINNRILVRSEFSGGYGGGAVWTSTNSGLTFGEMEGDTYHFELNGVEYYAPTNEIIPYVF